MSGVILDSVKAVAGPVKSLVVDRIKEYLNYISSYEDNMTDLLMELNILCSKKQDIDAKVMEGKERLRVMTRETTNWLKSLNKLIEMDEMKQLMKEDRVAEIAVKMMEQRVMKKLLKENREIFDIVVKVVKMKCNKEVGDGEIVDIEEDDDYKKVAKIASEVMKDVAEEFKKFIKTDEVAAAAVILLNNVDLEKLKQDDGEMAKILSKAEGISRKEIEHNDHNEKELLLKHNDDVLPVGKNVLQEKVGILRKHLGSLMAFLNDDNFKKGLGDGARLGLEVMDAMSKSEQSEQVKDNAKQHRYCGGCVNRFEGYRHRHDMSHSAETMVKAIKSMIIGCPPGPVTRLKRADELEDISNEFVDGLESREELLQKILSALKDDQVNIVGVYGMGGAGKTTLAKEVASKRASDFFDKRIVVEISEAPDIKSIQNQIAERINLPLEDAHTVAQRAQRLYNGLKSEKKRKILIILDNIWKKLKLDEVGIPRDSTKDFCCKLMITTRERQVCRAMDVENANIFEVGMLNEREAVNLFENQSGKKVDSGEYKPLVDRLLRKCGGLPLAIVASASALRGKDFSMWCQFAEELEKPISSQVSSEYRETYSILETSYKLIETEEKRMFFFLACLSPLDSALLVDDLMRYGIGLDLFQRLNNLSEATKQAKGWVDELVYSSLLLKDDTDGQLRIHDVVRASAISFDEKGKDRMTLIESIPQWMCKEAFEKFTAISLLSGRDFSDLSGVKAPILEILLLKGDVSLTKVASNFFDGMTNLKVLSLSNMNFELGLPESMGQLERLKTLHLHHCQLKDIKMIGKLVNLLVLSLRESSLKGLADEIGELCNLRVLDMGGCKGNVSIPANIFSRLSRLEGIYMFNSFVDWASVKTEVDDGGANNKARVSEVYKLSRLNVLEMEVSYLEQLPALNFSQLVEQLDKFRIHVGGFRQWDMDKVQAFRYVLELNNIVARGNMFLRALLKKTDCLQISDCKSLIENFVLQLDEEGLKDLNYMEVRNCNNVKFIATSNTQNQSTAFASLEILKLSVMERLETICDGKAPTGIFSNLQSLSLDGLPKLKYGLPLTFVPLKLAEVSINACESLELIVFEDVPESFEEAVEKETIWLPYLKSLNLGRMRSLLGVLGQAKTIDDVTQADQSFFNAKSIFPSLERLWLAGNNTTVTLWSNVCHVSSFQNLKVMYICLCTELQSLGSPSIFAHLCNLKN